MGATVHEAKSNEALIDPSCWRPQQFVADGDRDDGHEDEGEGGDGDDCALDLVCKDGSTALLCGTCHEERIFSAATMTCVSCKGYAAERARLYVVGVCAIIAPTMMVHLFSTERLKIWKHMIFVKLLEP